MQSNQQFHPQKAVLPHTNQVGNNYMHNFPIASAFGTVLPPGAKSSRPCNHAVEFQPSEVCPKNFIIFDQNDHRSQIMFHPAVAHKFTCPPGLTIRPTYNFEKKDTINKGIEIEVSSSILKEDSADIDALLSLEEEEEEEEEEYEDEEEVSTARTNTNYGSDSPEPCSRYASKPSRKIRVSSSSSIQKSSSSSGSSCNSERKRMKMNKMVKVLRGIVPGGNQINTVAVLDEAVRYLKSLKVEVQKLGVGNLNK